MVKDGVGNLPFDVVLIVNDDVGIVKVRMHHHPWTMVVLRYNVPIDHRSEDQVVNHCEGVFSLHITAQSSIYAFRHPGGC